MNQERLWTHEFIFVCLINFLLFMASNILMTVLPLYLVDRLHTGPDKVGLVVTGFLVAAIITRPFVGEWVKRSSLKRILVLTDIPLITASLLYPLATNVWLLLALRFFHGITFGITTTVCATICTEIIPISKRGEGLGYYSTTMSLTMVLGPYIALSLANQNAYTLAFLLCSLISAGKLGLALFLKLPERTKETAPLGKVKISFADLFDKKAAPYALSVFLLASAASGITSFSALFAKDLGFVSSAGYFFILYALFIIISRTFTGRFADQFGLKVVIYPSIVLFGVGMFLLSQTQTVPLLLIAAAILGLGFGSVIPLFQTHVINVVEPHRVLVANSFYFNALDGGFAVGAYIWGILAGFTGYRSIYQVSVVVIIIAGFQYFTLNQRKSTTSVCS